MIVAKASAVEGVSIFHLSGKAEYSDIIEFISRHLPAQSHALIWDISDGDISALSEIEFRNIVKLVSDTGRHKATAYVSSDDLQYGILRMYEVWASMDSQAPLLKVTRTLAEAEQWIAEVC